MKKLVSLLLAAMMLLSCTGAMAAFSESFKVEDAATFKGAADATSADASSDIWIQVEASGQIDVTIPLVAVFKTNIDGGTATIDEAYKLVNNSSAALKVTKVAITDTKEKFTQNGVEENMTLMNDTEFDENGYNQYMLTMKPTDRYASPVWTTALDVYDGVYGTDVAFVTSGNVSTITRGTEKEAPGLWRIEKADTAKDTDESYVDLTLTTSKLTFVTNQKTDDKADAENGVKLFTITYTVAIDDSTAVGGDIEGTFADGANTDHAYSYAGE